MNNGQNWWRAKCLSVILIKRTIYYGDNNGHGLKIVTCEETLTFECIYFVSEILYTYDIVTISSDREKDSDAHKEEIRTYEDRLENTRQQLLGERNKNLKKTNKEVAEVK